MDALKTLTPELRDVAGVVTVFFFEKKVTVRFRDGVVATIERCPLSNFSDRESYDVYLPSKREGFAAEVAASKSPKEVISLLHKLAAKAARLR